jgi:hypothetical protein
MRVLISTLRGRGEIEDREVWLEIEVKELVVACNPGENLPRSIKLATY